MPLKQVHVNGNAVDTVRFFVYLGSQVDCTGSSEAEVLRRIAIARDCMKALDRNVWRSSITTATKIRLYFTYIAFQSLSMAEKRGR